MKRLTFIFTTLAFLLASTVSFAGPGVKVASKNFTEQLVLGQIMVQLLKDRDIPVVDKTNLGGTQVNRNALKEGQIDVYMEYTGTAWITHFGKEEVVRDSNELYEKVKTLDREKNNLVWLEPCKFNNTYAIIMKEETAAEHNISTLSEWAEFIEENPGKMTVAVGPEFYSRVDGFKGMMGHYNLEFGEDIPDSDVSKMEIALTKKSVRDGKAMCGMAFATDSAIIDYGLRVLEDDKNYFPIYNPAPVVRKEVLDQYPKLAYTLNQIGTSLDTATMQRLNYRVNANGEKPSSVAQSWLEGVGLITKKRK
ncbi:MAG: glycine betaine ABC transporter substrate-binding protein [Desulfobacteraceae bacterium]